MPIINTIEYEDTNYYQINVKGICLARRQDNNMVNGTKLLNITGISRTRRNIILGNEDKKIVVKVGPMHLKGVWIPLLRARELSVQYNIKHLVYPLLVNDPYIFSNPHKSKL